MILVDRHEYANKSETALNVVVEGYSTTIFQTVSSTTYTQNII